METVPRGTLLSEPGSLDPWFVTGLIQGAASFTYSRSGRIVSPYLGMKAKSADLELLVSVRSFLGGAGEIFPIRDRDRLDPDEIKGFYFRVSRSADLARVVEHLDRYPCLGTKAERYEIWREMVLGKRIRSRAESASRLDELALRLTEITTGHARRE